ncbi:MAG: hypothetical protein KDB35_13320 [Acidimicrobiales bacterium]|nr:hypothetical protein [Acidimicrobiales bacterium]
MITVAIGPDGTFTYTTDIPGLPTFDVTTEGGQGTFEEVIPAGTWTITQEGPPAPFAFQQVEGCETSGAPGSVTITVADGDREICTFTNRSPGTTVQGPDVSGPFPATSSPAVSSLTPDGPQSGMGAPLPPADVPPGAPASLGTFAGLSTENGTFRAPLDPNGDVGPAHYVQTVNTMFAVFAKDGTLLAGPFDNNRLWDGVGGQCEANNDGDPIVLHDQLADRWLLGQFYLGDSGDGPYGMCLAVSQTSDPTGAYHLYEVPAPWFNDYPKLGVWDDAYYMTTQPGGFNKADLYALDRDAMLAGIKNLGADAPIDKLMRETSAFKSDMPLTEAFTQMRNQGRKAEVVVDRSGAVIGMLTLENVAEMMMVENARPGWHFAKKP